MKLTITKSILLNGLLCLFVLVGCGKTTEQESASSTVPETVSEPAVSSPAQYYINTIDNEKLGEISFQGEKILLSTTGTQFFGVLKKTGKRKYYDQDDQMQYAVKYSDDGFKLRDSNENLLWKIKIDDKIKIANNEEMTDAYKISRTNEGKIKLKKDEEEVDAIRVSADSPSTTINGKYSVHSFGNSLALGILLIDELSDEQKIVLCAEILNQQK